MKICWAHDWDMKGNGYGYSNHTRMMKKYLQAAGVEIDPAADIAIHILVPTGFEPIPGKFNILFTMYEAETIPDEWVQYINRADMIIVPCQHNKRLFEKYTDLPIEVCQEGFDTSVFLPELRTFPGDGEPFRFLWVGASNPRKGYEYAAFAWERFAKKYPEECKRSILVMKTTQVTKEERTVKMGNVYFESHDFKLEELIHLYEISHCFLFPTMGEGWGLTLMEACATGLPAIYTPYSGVNDFMVKELAYPLRWKFRDIRTMKINDDGSQEEYHATRAAEPDMDHLARRMAQVVNDYDRAADIGYKNALRLRKLFDWSKAADRMIEIVQGVENFWRVAV